MNKYEEAIKLLERRTTIPDDSASFDDINNAIDMAIEALRNEQKRAQGCEWCKEYAGVPLCGFSRHGATTVTVKCCPMCGKELEVHHD